MLLEHSAAVRFTAAAIQHARATGHFDAVEAVIHVLHDSSLPEPAASALAWACEALPDLPPGLELFELLGQALELLALTAPSPISVALRPGTVDPGAAPHFACPTCGWVPDVTPDPDGAPWELEDYELRPSDDSVRADLELIHTPCGEVLCDAEAEDSLRLLASMAYVHRCTDEPADSDSETWPAPRRPVFGDSVPDSTLVPAPTNPFTHRYDQPPELSFVTEIRGRACSVTAHPGFAPEPTLNVRIEVFYRKPLTFQAQFTSSDVCGPWELSSLLCRQDGSSAAVMGRRLCEHLPGALAGHAGQLALLVGMGRERAAAHALQAAETARSQAATAQEAAVTAWSAFTVYDIPAERAAEVLTQVDRNWIDGRYRRTEQDPTYKRPRISDRLRNRLHRMARFWPIDLRDETTLPAISVAGVMVFAYIDSRTREFRVSIHLDTAHRALVSPQGTVPLRVDVGSSTVHHGPIAAEAPRTILFHAP